MKTIGSLLIPAGIMLMVYAFTLETSVEVNYQNGNSLGLPNRVNNIGLMADKQNYLIGSGVLLNSRFNIVLLTTITA
ncbi:hypothetical protein EMGBS15_06020 [Filimonas sp.]|nr:hypothetical protein EMGBS15_06020 [Filimonas sp.]